MRWLVSIAMILSPLLAQAQTITVAVPSAVADQIDVYRAECTGEGGELELDGDEIFKVRTDEGEEAYVIRAAFTCGDIGEIWCGYMGHCMTQIVIDNKLYETNRILTVAPNRISKAKDGTITYWLPNGIKLAIGD
jgi:hypothetical protein